MTISKLKVFIKKENKFHDIASINFEVEVVSVREEFEYKNYYFKDVVFVDSTEIIDKNGREIYEGDVVVQTSDEIIHPDSPPQYIGIVKQLEGSWVIDTGNSATYLWTELEENLVIGNSYEEPELVERVKK